jgi:hypothetical protein
MDVLLEIWGAHLNGAVLISLAGGVAAVAIKGVESIRQALAVVLVALVAGIWISPLAIMLAARILGGPIDEAVADSITAIVAISSWNLLEALVGNRVLARLMKKVG